MCSQCWRESRTLNPFPSPSTSPHQRATLSPTREHTVPTPRGRLHPRQVRRVPPSSSFFLSFLSLSSLRDDVGRHRDVSGWNGLLLAVVSRPFFHVQHALPFWAGWTMVALFLFLLFSFPRFFERANGGECPTMFGLY